jgi:nucleosome binding factor SPN SPT16 subunit
MELQIEPIMVGKKKTKDIQFYVTVIDAVESLEQNRKSYYDPEEIEEEQREKERRAKVNQVRPRTAMKEFVCESDHWG